VSAPEASVEHRTRRPRRISPARAARYQAEKKMIMRAAYDLIGRNEPKGTSVHDILDQTGLSTRSFYRHFRSKDELVLAMYRDDSDRVTTALATAVAAAATPTAALEAWIDTNLAVVYDSRKRRHAVALSSTEAAGAAGFSAAFIDGAASQRAVLVEVLHAGREQGVFPAADPGPDAYAIQAIIANHIRARLHDERGVSRADAVRHTLDFSRRALGAPS
jgi:AcrR family transcriptional regulator